MARSRTAQRAAVWGGGLIVVAVLVWLGWQLQSGDLDRNDKLASVMSLFIGLASLTVGVMQLRQGQGEGPIEDAVQLDWASNALAEAVRAQWEFEVGVRSLSRPKPLRLHWSSSGRPVAAPPNPLSVAALSAE